jgi:hypothetical protein
MKDRLQKFLTGTVLICKNITYDSGAGADAMCGPEAEIVARNDKWRDF